MQQTVVLQRYIDKTQVRQFGVTPGHVCIITVEPSKYLHKGTSESVRIIEVLDIKSRTGVLSIKRLRQTFYGNKMCK